ncbi:MAG: folylpolyglutamate synthase/dihydrofolate synthase family protein [Pyrinomonadaceae bacterium]
MNFRESEEYLYSLGNEVAAMKLGLENISRLLAALDNPQNNYLKVQVAGTNGKGSVCALLHSICNQAGIRTGTFTSPHLISITERIRINGGDIGEDDFARFASVVKNAVDQMIARGEAETPLTFFEQITAIALIAFAEAKIEIAILETGLGGRLDATTAAQAEIAAITRIDLDHQEYLGETIGEIAAEKAAIIRQDSRVVIGPQRPEARAATQERLDDVANKGGNPAGTEGAIFVTEANVAHVNTLGLIGRHQQENAAIAVAVALILRESFTISEANINAGLAEAKHPGRLEYTGRFLFDGAHNPGGAKALRDFLNESERRPVTLVFGAMQDKNVAAMAAVLFPLAKGIVLTRPSNTRAMEPEAILRSAPPEVDKSSVPLINDVEKALAAAVEMTPAGGIVLVSGSLYLVGEAKQILKSQI